ncbi:MAG: 2-oxoacid:acceptor oxidoreductase family protein [Spirochaetaceae bacterium]|nr:2-oxoacid:acceptor oxidoreductase family protein [Spirochaetaceae bacterium]
MHKEIIFAGFGGQGVILAGKIICIAAMMEGKYVSHIPSYGAEMRGGTANCGVVISEEEVASPVVEHPDICIVLNAPSMVKFEPRLKKGGVLIYNSSLIKDKPKRTDIETFAINANEISEKHGSSRGVNMAALGFLVKKVPELVKFDSLTKALDEAISERNRKHNPVNVAIMTDAYNLLP